MAELAADTNAVGFSVNTTSVAVVRGVRVILDSTRTVSVADHTVRGDFVTKTAIPASSTGLATPMQGAAIVSALANGACAVNDPAYAADSGKFSNSSASSAVLVGKWVLATSGDGVLGEVLLENPA